MIVQIIVQGRLKNRIIEKSVQDDQLVPWLMFTNDNGLFLEDMWIPSERIKEIRYEEPAAPMVSRQFFADDKDED